VKREVTVPTDRDRHGEREFTVYRTHRGPIVRAVDDQWVSVALMEEPLRALIQSYSRTKAEPGRVLEAMEAHTNSSNNTLFADADGNIAYLHSNFVPGPRPRFDYDRRWTAATRPPTGRACTPSRSRRTSINPERLGVLHQQLAVLGGRPASPRPATSRATWTGSENPRGIHASCCCRADRLHARVAARRGVQQLTCRRSRDGPAARARMGRAARRNPLKRARRSRSRCCATGTCAGTSRPCRPRSPCSGGPSCWARAGRRARRGRGRLRVRGDADHARGAARRAGRRGRPALRGLRRLAHAVGRDQPVPAPHRRHRSCPSTTTQPSSRSASLGALGLARLLRRGAAQPARSGGTAPAATASSRSSSSASACAPWPSPPAD
jgi:hypothetical protein